MNERPAALPLLDEVVRDLMGSPLIVGCDVRQIEVTDRPPIEPGAACRAALQAPRGTPPLREFAADRRTAVIITSDATRAVPSAALLPPLLHELAAAGIPAERVTVVIGTGAHRAPTDDELRGILGDLYGQLRVQSHDARASDLVEVGRSRRGTPVLIDRTVAQADLRIALGEVEQHEFAGFTGGRKAILPAVAGQATILANHALDMLAHPGVGPGALDGNVIHEEMLEAARLARLDFIVNVVVDRELKVVALAAGDFEQAHADLVSLIRRYATVSLERRPDVIVTGPDRPLDINLYQATKALSSIVPLVGQRSAILLLSACHEGIGANELAAPFVGAQSPEEVIDNLRHRYVVEHNGAFMLADFLRRCPSVVACCPGVSNTALRTLLLEPVADPQAGMARALGVADSQPRDGRPLLVAFIPRSQRLLLSLDAG